MKTATEIRPTATRTRAGDGSGANRSRAMGGAAMNGANTTMVAHAHHGPEGSGAPVRHVLRHFGEMFLAMLVGMAAAVPVLGLLGTLLLPGLTPAEALARYPVVIPVVVCLVMATAMTAPMAAWMRHRGMAWRPVTEMAAAMFAPLVPIFALLGAGVLPGAAACCTYCGVMVLAMVADMLYRRDLYTTGHLGHAAHAA
jgi:hypothetical protein